MIIISLTCLLYGVMCACVCVYNLWQPFPLIATDDDDDDYVDYDTHQKMRAFAHLNLSDSEWNDSRIKIQKTAESTEHRNKCRNVRLHNDGTLSKQ